MTNNSKRLINKLDNIVDITHINEVKQIIDALANVNDFKHSLTDTDNMDTIYIKILHMLENNFNIKDFRIIQIVNKIETIKYETVENKTFPYEFKTTLGIDGTIKFCLDNSILDEFNRTYLDNYLEEISHILYVQLVLLALQESAYIDTLTKLKNRLAFHEDMKEVIPIAVREKMKIGVLLINIDRFRAVNDEHGTAFGDRFLQLYAKVIKEKIRTSDIAVRFSGGEFLILLMNVIDDDKILQIANNLKDNLAQTSLLTTNNDEFKKTVSIGISVFPEDSDDIHEVVQNAELALSDARDKGRNEILKYEKDDGEMDFF